MKYNSILFIVCIALSTCSKTQPSFDWLVGSWERTNGKSGTQTFESWEKIGDETYNAISVVLQGADTVYTEHCTIKKEGDNFYYIAEVPQNSEATYFKISNVNGNSFTAENPEHDFPKKIQYLYRNGELRATISGGDKKIEYLFKKRN
jgi:hypothetical protein